MKPFRFGLGATVGAPLADWQELARRAEGLGYSTITLGDHLDGGVVPLSGAAPLLALAAAAAVTTRLRVGTLMLGNDFRHPVLLAKEAATLDVISGARFELGLGAGWNDRDYELLELHRDPLQVRVERLGEALQIIKAAWAGDAFDFAGEHYSLREYAAQPRPAQQAGPPIVVGGSSEPLLRLAGQHADVVGIHMPHRGDLGATTAEELVLKRIGWVRESAGERFDQIELQMMSFAAITDDPVAAAEAFSARWGLSAESLLQSSMTVMGSVEEICELLQQRREAWGISYYILSADVCESFAPVVSRLAGT